MTFGKRITTRPHTISKHQLPVAAVRVWKQYIYYDHYEQDGEVGIFYGVSAGAQGKDWDPAKAEGPTGSPMWWGMVSTINGIIPFDQYDSLEEALKHAVMFVSKEEYDSNPYWTCTSAARFRPPTTRCPW